MASGEGWLYGMITHAQWRTWFGGRRSAAVTRFDVTKPVDERSKHPEHTRVRRSERRNATPPKLGSVLKMTQG